jgi:chromosome segregation ATPase
MKKVKGLETTLADWETRQFTNLKLIAGLEKERDSLQAKLKEMQDGNLSHEDQLYWKDVAIKNKEKEVKSLRTELDEKEARSAELQKEITESEGKIKALEAQNTSLDESVVSLTKEGQKSAGELIDLKKQVGNQTNEIKHLKIVLAQKVQELSSINTTAVCQKAELDRLMRENEKFESDYSKAIAQLEIVKNSKKDVMKKLQMKELSLQAMKARVASLVERDKAREEDRLEMEMRNQVLSDMDRVIQIQTRESNTGEVVVDATGTSNRWDF